MKAAFLTFLALLALCSSALAGGTVTNLTQGDLQKALVGGGTVLFAATGTLTLTSTITIGVNTTLDANGHAVIISGGKAVRLFQVNSNVTFGVTGLTLADGQVVAEAGGAFGAGIWNQGGQVVLTSCALSNNSVQGANDGSGGNGFGAAICTMGGRLSITNCSITSNQAVGGAVPYANARSALGQGMGGAIYSQGTELRLQGLVLSNNTVTGGIPSESIPGLFFWGPGGNGLGGALYVTNSTVTMNSCLVQSNTAYGGEPPPPRLQGASGPGSGNGNGGGLFVCTDSMCAMSDCTLVNNSAIGGPGARNYGGGSGKGGDVFSNGHLQLQQSTFSNSHTMGGQALFAPGVAQGGAIYSTGVLSINGCAFVDGFATGGNSLGLTDQQWPGAAAEGGGLWLSGTFACTNSTITACRVLGGRGGGAFAPGPGGTGTGGGLYLTNGTAALENLTVAANRADGTNIYSSGGGPALGGNLAVNNAAVTVLNSIIANSGNGGDVWGSVTDGGYNICSDGTANFSAPGSLNQADPLLATLSNNGGPTPTMALLVGSPARDAIVSNFPPIDQRGVARPQGPAADIGAFEAAGGGVTYVVPARVGQTLTLTFNAEAGRTYRLLSSTNFTNWSPVGTNTALSAGPLQFLQTINPGPPLFYRVVTP